MIKQHLLLEVTMCGSKKISIPTRRRVTGNSKGGVGGGGDQKPKYLKECMNENWIFQRGGGSNQRTLCGRGMDIFWNNTVKIKKLQGRAMYTIYLIVR